MIELLDAQRGLFRELDGLSELQSKWVSTGETERLLSVLAQKQTVVERVQAVNASLQPFMADWGARVAGLPERSRVLLRSRTDEIEALAGRVKTRDEADRASLEASSRVIADDLAGMARARGAARAYGGGAGTSVLPRGGGGGGGGGLTGGAMYQDRRG
ncbi:MAG: flagellar export chaperone FlgN [Phycisphaerales bacterium]